MSKFLQFALLILALQPLPAFAQTDTQYGFPVTDTPPGDLPCYMVANNRNTLNLGRLCGTVPAVRSNNNAQQNTNIRVPNRSPRTVTRSTFSESSVNNRFNSYTTNNSDSNKCDYPWQRDAAGNLCGNRARYASEEPPALNPQLVIDPSLMPTYSGSGSSSSGSSGNCQYSWQLDANGNLCGGRAASERSGGN